MSYSTVFLIFLTIVVIIILGIFYFPCIPADNWAALRSLRTQWTGNYFHIERFYINKMFCARLVGTTFWCCIWYGSNVENCLKITALFDLHCQPMNQTRTLFRIFLANPPATFTCNQKNSLKVYNVTLLFLFCFEFDRG